MSKQLSIKIMPESKILLIMLVGALLVINLAPYADASGRQCYGLPMTAYDDVRGIAFAGALVDALCVALSYSVAYWVAVRFGLPVITQLAKGPSKHPIPAVQNKTIIITIFAIAWIVVANIISKRVPFKEQFESDGYMIKMGWPCSFYEQTKHAVIWEWADVLIDFVIGSVLVFVVGIGANLTIVDGWNYVKLNFTSYIVLVLGIGGLIAINLAERIVDFIPERGWPITFLIGSPTGLHHNRILPWGMTVDAGVSLLILLLLLKVIRVEQKSPEIYL